MSTHLSTTSVTCHLTSDLFCSTYCSLRVSISVECLKCLRSWCLLPFRLLFCYKVPASPSVHLRLSVSHFSGHFLMACLSANQTVGLWALHTCAHICQSPCHLASGHDNVTEAEIRAQGEVTGEWREQGKEIRRRKRKIKHWEQNKCSMQQVIHIISRIRKIIKSLNSGELRQNIISYILTWTYYKKLLFLGSST